MLIPNSLWIVHFLLNRTQSVRFQSVLSSHLCTSTDVPQGTVLAPVLFTLYTNDCRGTDIIPLIKNSDDSAIEDLSNSDDVHFNAVQRFYTRCKQNFLDLTVLKTKEMLIDFQTNPPPVPYLEIKDNIVERVEEFKYLGTMIGSNLASNKNADAIHRKCQPRLCTILLAQTEKHWHWLQDFANVL